MDTIKATAVNGETLELSPRLVGDFRKIFKGTLVQSGDGLYDEYRSVWNGMIDKRPCLIARCKNREDIIEAVKFARKNNLLVSLKSGGHHVSGRSLCDGGMVIDLSQMKKVKVDKENSTAIVEGGATLGDIDAETSKYGLVAPLGVVSATGVAGLTLHGGYGWHTRKHGLALDNIISAEVVTAGGKLVVASPDNNSDLFWAIRGGGGNFGVVTSFEFKLYPVESKVWMLLAIYPFSESKKCLEFMREYMPQAPDELTVIGVIWNAPEEKFIPEEFRGKPAFIFLGCYSGDLKKGEKVIAPFRNLDKLVADASQPTPFIDLQKFLDQDYPNGRLYYWKSAYINGLDDETIDTLIDFGAKRTSPLSSVDVWTLGGKAGRIDSDSSAFFQRNSPYMIGIEANWDDPDQSQPNIKWARDIYSDLTKNNGNALYLNFPGFGEEGEDLLKKAYGPNFQRLKEIKAKYDPDNFFKGFISI